MALSLPCIGEDVVVVVDVVVTLVVVVVAFVVVAVVMAVVVALVVVVLLELTVEVPESKLLRDRVASRSLSAVLSKDRLKSWGFKF
ncbi:hypothetical protein BpHYR1_003153 [Brachionus plicatilis]|uniref:Uncharacterized protein n=1 Tax=Brachionus plicatilis TaxID=10195 RepID=A0A3M7QAC0_BRAPC|nr:hypothetical protein BpHYR1_003153 [Brachionus plicatilis]